MQTFNKIVLLVYMQFTISNGIEFSTAQELSRNNPNGLDSYTEDEFKKLPKLRAAVKNSVTDSYMLENKYLIRYLRSENSNVTKAEASIRRTLKWRKDNNIDRLVHKDFTRWQRRYPFYFNFDLQGRPGFAISLIDFDIRRIVLAGLSADFHKYYITILEQTVQALSRTSNATGKEMIAPNVLHNMAGFSRRSHLCYLCIPFWIEFTEITEKYYPRFGNFLIIVNVSRAFDSLYQTLKPLHSSHTVNVTRIYGVDKGSWVPELLKLYAKDQLLLEFGGTKPKRHWSDPSSSNIATQ